MTLDTGITSSPDVSRRIERRGRFWSMPNTAWNFKNKTQNEIEGRSPRGEKSKGTKRNILDMNNPLQRIFRPRKFIVWPNLSSTKDFLAREEGNQSNSYIDDFDPHQIQIWRPTMDKPFSLNVNFPSKSHLWLLDIKTCVGHSWREVSSKYTFCFRFVFHLENVVS